MNPTQTALWNDKVGFYRPFLGDFPKMTRIFRPSFVEKVGIVETYLKSIFESYLTYISVGLLDSNFLDQIPLSPNGTQDQKGTGKIWGTIVGTGTVWVL